jgi:hypothetical protein
MFLRNEARVSSTLALTRTFRIALASALAMIRPKMNMSRATMMRRPYWVT